MRLDLQQGPWQIEITALPELKELEEILKRDGGYAITHTCNFMRADGKTFSIKDAQHLLEGLRLFFSFARGAFCASTFHQGLNRHDELVWEQWGAHTVMPWIYTPSWFDRMNGHMLALVFPGFWNLYNDPSWTETVNAALYWYLRSNAHGRGAGVDGGILLTQAALERLASNMGHRGKAAERIRKALDTIGISLAIPASCKKLNTLKRKYQWEDGPRAFIEIRNDLIHPRQKFGNTLAGSYLETWKLGQWYTELILLWLFDYNGKYGNRLTQKTTGEVVKVPWG